MSSPLFIENPGILVDKDYIFDFIPNTNATMEERINAIVRFSLYFSVLLMIVKNNYRYVYIFVATLFITVLFYSNNRENFTNIENFNNLNNSNANSDNDCLQGSESKSKNDSEECDQPTCNNLFMNVLPTSDFKKKKKACSFNKEISDKVNSGFYNKFKKDVNTFYNQDFGMRQFYSMPNTQVPNDQGAFANWLYNTPVSCSVGDNMLLKQQRACSLDSATLEDYKDDNSFLCLSNNYNELN
mgnify:FL=1|jgi:hypothetical protein